jgi:hypothetical protein
MFRVVFILFFALIGVCQAQQWTEMVFNGGFDDSRGSYYGWRVTHRQTSSSQDYVTPPRSAVINPDSGVVWQEPPELGWPSLTGPGTFRLNIGYSHKFPVPGCSLYVIFEVVDSRNRAYIRTEIANAVDLNDQTNWTYKDTIFSFQLSDTESISRNLVHAYPRVVIRGWRWYYSIKFDGVSVGYQWVPTGVEQEEPARRLPTAFLRPLGTYNILGQRVEHLRPGQVGFVVRNDGSVKKILNLR